MNNVSVNSLGSAKKGASNNIENQKISKSKQTIVSANAKNIKKRITKDNGSSKNKQQNIAMEYITMYNNK